MGLLLPGSWRELARADPIACTRWLIAPRKFPAKQADRHRNNTSISGVRSTSITNTARVVKVSRLYTIKSVPGWTSGKNVQSPVTRAATRAVAYHGQLQVNFMSICPNGDGTVLAVDCLMTCPV